MTSGALRGPVQDGTGAGSGLLTPSVWPWADLYAEALVATGRADEADAFLRPHERSAAGGPVSAAARLARARGRIDLREHLHPA